MDGIDPGRALLIGFLICAFCAIQFVVLALLLWYFAGRRNSSSVWKVFAQKHGLSYQPPGFMEGGYGSMSGQMNGRYISFYCRRTGGRTSVTWTVAAVRSNSRKEADFSIGAKGFDGAVYKAFGAQDILIGIEEFDHEFTIQSNPANLASTILLSNADLRAMIQKLKPYELQYKDGIASCRVLGPQSDETVLLNMLDLADKLAGAMENS